MKSILDPTFAYVPSVKTDIRKTFARIRAEQKVRESREKPRDKAEEAREASLRG